MNLSPLRLKHPIVLIHGLGAPSMVGSIDYFYGLPERFREAGNSVYVANLSAFQTTEIRAEQLKAQIDQVYPNEKVNLIGHSLGGLDARFLTSCLGFAERVQSLTTIGTPHRGTVLGDVAGGVIPDHAFGRLNRFMGLMGMSAEAFKHVTTQYTSEVFSRQAPNIRGVAYFSATSAIPDPIYQFSLPIFWLSHQLIKRYEGDNDGFVSVHSAQWGEHICTHSGDHYAQIGHILGRCRGLDYLAFYDEILARLKKEGM